MLEEMKHKLARRRQNCDEDKLENNSLIKIETPTKALNSPLKHRVREESPAKLLSPINKIVNSSLNSLKKMEVISGDQGIELVQNLGSLSPNLEKQELVQMKDEILQEIRTEIEKSKLEIIQLIRDEIQKIRR